jgi:hypothetical protein
LSSSLLICFLSCGSGFLGYFLFLLSGLLIGLLFSCFLLLLNAASDFCQSLLGRLSGMPRRFGFSSCLGDLGLLTFSKLGSCFSGLFVARSATATTAWGRDVGFR